MTSSIVPALLLTAASLGGAPRGVVLDFSATWCGPCQQMNPIVSRLERQGYPIRKVDVDKEPDLARRFNVSSIPAFVLVVDGKEVTRLTGRTSEEQLRGLLAQIPSDPPPVAPTSPPRTAIADSQSAGPPPVAAEEESIGGPQQRPAPAPMATVEVEPEQKPAGVGGMLKGLFRRGDETPAEPPIARGKPPEVDESINLLPIRDPLQASLRLHVTVNGQTSVGSGTAIDSRPGRTVLVTCGHLFQGWNEQSKIVVDAFTRNGPQQYVGRMVSYDVAADVGIVTINTDAVIATAQVPDESGRPQTQERVVNIGCSGGAPPTQEPVQVTALNYFEGPDNIECTGVPVQGRSGGGLFNQQGQLIGVCIGADAQRQRGAYAGLLAIHDQLDAAGLSDLYRTMPPAGQQNLAGQPPHPSEPEGMAQAGTAPSGDCDTRPAPFDAVDGETAASLASAGDAEVICIIRDRNQPGAPSRVVIIDRASRTFLNYLGGEVKPTATTPQPAATNAYRITVPTEETPQLTDPQTMFRPATQRSVFGESRSLGTGTRSRGESIQPTALEKPFVPQRFVRSR